MRVAGGLNLPGGDFSLYTRQSQNFVPGGLHGAGFMAVDVAGVGAERSLMGAQRRRNHDHVDLCSADDEMNGSIRARAFLPDQIGCASAIGIFPVAGCLLQIGTGEHFQNFRVSAFAVVAIESNHSSAPFPVTIIPFSAFYTFDFMAVTGPAVQIHLPGLQNLPILFIILVLSAVCQFQAGKFQFSFP